MQVPQKPDSLDLFWDLDLEAVVSPLVWVLRSKLSPTAKAIHAPNHGAIPQTPKWQKSWKCLMYVYIFLLIASLAPRIVAGFILGWVFSPTDENNEKEGLESLHAMINNFLEQIINSRSEILMGQLHRGMKAFIVYHQLIMLFSCFSPEHKALVSRNNPVSTASSVLWGGIVLVNLMHVVLWQEWE